MAVYTICRRDKAVTSERLVRFIMQLQNEKKPAERRQLLLDEIRQCSGAHLAALFLYVPGAHAFVLRGYSGAYPPGAPHLIPGGGGLSMAQAQQGWLLLPAQESRQYLNSQELAWIERSAFIFLHSLRSSKRSEAEGVILLAPRDTGPQGREGMEALDVYVSLLPAYLSLAQEEESVMQETQTNPRTVPAENALARSIDAGAHQDTPTLATGLSKLYEVMLIGEYKVEDDALYSLLVEQMSDLIGAEQAWLFLYQAEQQRFSLAGKQEAGDAEALLRRLPEPGILEELAEREPGETMTTLHIEDGVLLILPLSHEPGLSGVALFRLSYSMPPFETRLVLSYMARVAILLLRDREAHATIQRESMLEERNRLARDIHDGPAQQLTLALLKLEYVQRRLLKSPEHAESAFWHTLSEDLDHVGAVLRECVEDLRHTITSELPMQLEQQSFMFTLRLELTEREREVLRLMSEGLPNRAIASRLLISIETVKTHIHHIMQKLQARDRTQAVALAMKYGLI
jgi:DNA-binding CsgD family transcriptional regulator